MCDVHPFATTASSPSVCVKVLCATATRPVFLPGRAARNSLAPRAVIGWRTRCWTTLALWLVLSPWAKIGVGKVSQVPGCGCCMKRGVQWTRVGWMRGRDIASFDYLELIMIFIWDVMDKIFTKIWRVYWFNHEWHEIFLYLNKLYSKNG